MLRSRGNFSPQANRYQAANNNPASDDEEAIIVADDISKLINMPLAQSLKRTSAKQAMIKDSVQSQKWAQTNTSSKMTSKLKF